jgi:hypothetical protein
MNEFVLFAVKSKKVNKTNLFVCLFFGIIYGVQICFWFYLTFNSQCYWNTMVVEWKMAEKPKCSHKIFEKFYIFFFLFLSHCNFRISETPDLKIPAKLYIPSTLKHWPYTMAHTIDCVCSKLLNHGLFLSLLKLIPYPIHWIVYVSAYSEVPNKRVTFFPASPGQASWRKCNTLIRNFRVGLG